MNENENCYEAEISLNKTNSRILDSSSILQNIKRNPKQKKNNLFIRKTIGYIMMFIVIIISVLSSIWVKKIGEDVKAFTLTYLGISFLTILIGVSCIKKIIIKCCKKKVVESENDISNLEKKTQEDTFSETFEKILVDNRHNYENKFHKMSIFLMIFWYFGNSFYNYGLNLTSITSANSLSNFSIIFILLEKILVFKSKCSIFKIVGTILCAGGVGMMMAFESSIKQEKERSFLGDVLIVIGAFIYSIYANLLSYYSKKHKHHFDMMEVFGYIGFYNMILIPFVLIILGIFNIEKNETPSLHTLFYIFINAVVAGIFCDLLQSYSITYLSPHIVGFGLTLTIPLSYLYDYFQGNITVDIYYVGGFALIFSAFCLIFIENCLKYKRKRDIPNILKNDESI